MVDSLSTMQGLEDLLRAARRSYESAQKRNFYPETGAPHARILQLPGERYHFSLPYLEYRADEEGRGYQTMMNEALREYLGKAGHPLDEEAMRRILREELKSVV